MKQQTFFKCMLLSVALIFGSITIAQNVGIGTNTPVARLHIADSSVLFSGPNTLPATAGLPPVSGIGHRLMWFSNKAAFRAGGTANTSWDDTYIGKYSAAFGLSNKAAGMYSTSSGWGNSSSGTASFSTGYSNTSAGNYSAAFGNNVDAPAYASLVIGRYNVASGNSTSWVGTDPLFVVGNGYVYETSPGIGAIQKRNAFSIDKSGNTIVNGKMDVSGDVVVEGKANFENGVGINLTAGQTANTSLAVNGAVALKSSAQTITLANNYSIETQNVGFVKITYNESSTLNPDIKLKHGTDGQILVIQHLGDYPFKIYGGVSYPGFALVRLSEFEHTLRKFSTLTLIYSAGTGWLEIGYSYYR